MFTPNVEPPRVKPPPIPAAPLRREAGDAGVRGGQVGPGVTESNDAEACSQKPSQGRHSDLQESQGENERSGRASEGDFGLSEGQRTGKTRPQPDSGSQQWAKRRRLPSEPARPLLKVICQSYCGRQVVFESSPKSLPSADASSRANFVKPL
jgi:hypothetical protein